MCVPLSRELAVLTRMIHERFYWNAETEVRISCGILSSRHDHAKGARPRKRGGDAPGRGRACSHAGGLATRSVNSSRLSRVATARFRDEPS
jgi:hypothetical protein